MAKKIELKITVDKNTARRLQSIVRLGKYGSAGNFIAAVIKDYEVLLKVLTEGGHIDLSDRHGEVVDHNFLRHQRISSTSKGKSGDVKV